MAKESTGTTDKVKPPTEKPQKAEKQATTARLVAKGVPVAKAKELSGEDDNTLDRKAIADKRIAWQRTLKKAK